MSASYRDLIHHTFLINSKIIWMSCGVEILTGHVLGSYIIHCPAHPLRLAPNRLTTRASLKVRAEVGMSLRRCLVAGSDRCHTCQ